MLNNRRVIPGAAAILTLLIAMTVPIQAAQVQLTWNAPTTNAKGTPLTDLAGYRLYYGGTSRNYGPSIDVGNQTTYLLSGLVGGQTYYFAVTAYDTSGNQSILSDEATATTLTDPAPAPVASFTDTPTSGSAPLSVVFTDTSTGQITTWAWNFGDNTRSSMRHPQHTYASAGTYTVKLTVSGPDGSNTTTRHGYITVSVPPPPPTGLVAAYSFDQGTGSIVGDASGNNNQGMISGAQWTNSGRYCKTLVFDGVDDRVVVAHSPSLQFPSTAITVSAWVRPNGSSQAWSSVVQKVNTANYVSYAFGQNASNTRRFSGYLQVNGVGYTTAISQAMNDLTWYFVALIWQSGQKVTLPIYNANGSVFSTVTTTQAPTGTISYDASPLLMGEDEAGDNWKGRIDEVRIYNRALTASQIQTDMNTPVSPTGGAALVQLTPLAARLRARLGNASSAGSSATINQVESNADSRRSQRQRSATESVEASSQVQSHVLETGELQVTPQWQRIEFGEAFVDPIVVANAISINDGTPALVSIRHVEPTGFEIRMQQDDAAGTLPLAVAGFVAMERGTYTLADGTLVEAGRVEVMLSESSFALPFNRPFNHIPVVMTTVSGVNEVEPVISRLQAVTKSNLRVALHGGGFANLTGSLERLSYIAWEPSAGNLQGVAFEVGRTLSVAHGQWHNLTFAGAFAAPSVSLAEVQGGASGDPLVLLC